MLEFVIVDVVVATWEMMLAEWASPDVVRTNMSFSTRFKRSAKLNSRSCELSFALLLFCSPGGRAEAEAAAADLLALLVRVGEDGEEEARRLVVAVVGAAVTLVVVET